MLEPTALMTDLYQLTMAAGFFRHALHDKRVSFEMFVRGLPAERRFLLFAGLQTVVEYLRNLTFREHQIDYLCSIPSLRSAMSPELVGYLRDFRFQGDVYAVPEGTVCFGSEPMIRVTGTLFEAQLVETFILSAVNTETMVASKAARIALAADGRDVMEFGTRRTSAEEAVASARAAYIAGFVGTSNVEAGYRHRIPVVGTAAHSWTMAHASEEEAFRHYVEAFPDHTTLLVDTYDTLEGVRTAIRTAGARLKGIRLDSGDLASLAHQARRLLDEAGLSETKIVASNDLNETRIHALRAAGAPIDGFGVGTELVRSRDNPTLGGVYKLVYDHTEDRPVAKLSAGKSTLPGLHQVFRCVQGGSATHDVIGLHDETPPAGAAPLLVPWLVAGRPARPLPSLADIRAHAQRQLAEMPPRVRALAPAAEGDAYEVRLSPGLEDLLAEVRKRDTL